MPDPWLRKGFRLDGAPRRAAISVGSIGYHELFVNGRKVGDGVLLPSVTDNSKRARYRTYDLTEHLHSMHGLHEIPVHGSIAASSTMLPQLHKDPCDRVIISTAQRYDLIVLTPDALITRYPDVRTSW